MLNIYDIIIVVIILFFTYFGLKKGFVKSISGFVSIILSILIASLASKFISELVFNSFINDKLISQISSLLLNNKASVTSVFGVLNQIMPLFMKEQSVLNGVISDLNSALSANSAVLAVNAVKPLLLAPITSIVFAILAVVCQIVFKVIIRLIFKNRVMRKLSFIDRFFGGVFGLLKGFILICVLSFLLSALMPYLEGNNEIFSKSMIDSTYLFKYFYYGDQWNMLNRMFNVSDVIYKL